MNSFKVAILIPCYNEALTIARVISDFKLALPQADIYVYDNNSNDGTSDKAVSAGAIVRKESRQGKGNVVRRMFRDVEADFYIMVDGDDTYDASLAPKMVEMAKDGPFDLINCIRNETEYEAYREGHRFGNWLLNASVESIFGSYSQDMLSGYKVLSRRFVKSFPVISNGFDIETELTVYALELSMPIQHILGSYRARTEGSQSKLNTYQDGWRILMMILKLARHERPLIFFGVLSVALSILSLILAEPIMMTYLKTGLVPRLPTAILSMGIMLMAFLTFTVGIILDTVTRGRRELRSIIYLQIPATISYDHFS